VRRAASASSAGSTSTAPPTTRRAQVPSTKPTTSVALVGPTDLLTTIITGAAQDAAATLVQMLDESDRRDPHATERLRRLGAAAQAWAETYADCRTVEWFSFDPNWDPVERV
jgi:hypothetical protein